MKEKLITISEYINIRTLGHILACNLCNESLRDPIILHNYQGSGFNLHDIQPQFSKFPPHEEATCVDDNT